MVDPDDPYDENQSDVLYPVDKNAADTLLALYGYCTTEGDRDAME